VALISFTLVEGGKAVATPREALPVEVQDAALNSKTTESGEIVFASASGEEFRVALYGDGFALLSMRVCGGEIGEEAAA
jgi:hypothetical protein